MSLIQSIRQELQKLHGILKHGETSAEQVAHERLGTLHDTLVRIEAGSCTVELWALKEVRRLVPAADARVLANIDAAIAATEKHAAAYQAELDASKQTSQEAAATVAVTPAASPAPGASVVSDTVPASTSAATSTEALETVLG